MSKPENEPFVGSVNLTERDLSEAVVDWVCKRYGFKAGRWEARSHDEKNGVTQIFRWVEKEVPKP